MPSIFPLEIEETILDFLAEDDRGHSTLKMCSLVCQAFLHICRKHIFGSIILNNMEYGLGSSLCLTTSAFESLLRETPEIADYIHKLDYTIRNEDLTNPSIQESLKRISKVDFLTVRHCTWPVFEWSNRDNPIRPALLHLLHLPTLTHFKVNGIKNFVVSDLIPCVNLKYLDIGSYTTVAAETTFPAVFSEHSVKLNVLSVEIGTAGAIMKFCTARRPDGQPIINFGSLSKITVAFDKPNEEASQELFRHCHVLTNVHITFWPSRNVRPSLADMLRPSMQTLKHIVVNIHFYVNDDSLSGLLSVFEDMRTKNIIETVTIGIFDHIDADHHRVLVVVGGDWGRLDEVLTAPGWFSLKRVSLAIKIPGFRNDSDSDNKVDEALRKLPETQLQRLSSSNSVTFDFEVHSLKRHMLHSAEFM